MEYRAFLGTCCEGMRRKRTDRDREREADCAVLYSRVGMPGRRRTRGPRDEEARGQRGSCTLTITISIAGFQQWGRYFKNRILIRAGNPTLCNPYVSTWWMRGLAPSCVRVCHRSSSCLSLPSSHSRCLQLFPSWSYSFFILNYYHPPEALFFPSLFAVSGIPRLLYPIPESFCLQQWKLRYSSHEEERKEKRRRGGSLSSFSDDFLRLS